MQFQDAQSAESSWFQLPVILDRRPPRGNVVIEPTEASLQGGVVVDGGAQDARALTVSARVVAQDDRSGVAEGGAVSGTLLARLYRGPGGANPVVVPMGDEARTLHGVSLAGGADGPRQLILSLIDGAGNEW